MSALRGLLWPVLQVLYGAFLLIGGIAIVLALALLVIRLWRRLKREIGSGSE